MVLTLPNTKTYYKDKEFKYKGNIDPGTDKWNNVSE
jgi:hypothetical protein